MSNTQIPFSTAVTMTVNIMFGAGLFAGVHLISSAAGNAGFLVWGTVALLYLPIVYSISQLAILVPGDGGFYKYSREALGEIFGFISGILYYLCYILASTAVLSAFRDMLLVKFPSSFFLNNIPIFMFALTSIMILPNLVRISLLGKIQKYLTIAKIIPVILIVGILPLFLSNGFSVSRVEWLAAFSPSAITPALFGFLGFEFASNMSSQIEGGPRETAKVILVAFGIVTAVFTFFHFGLLQIMGTSGILKFGAAGFPIFLKPIFPSLVSPLLIASYFSIGLCYINSSNGMVTLSTAILLSIADGEKLRFSDAVTKLNSEGRPWVAVLFSLALITITGTIIPHTNLLMSLSSFGIVSALSVAVFSLLIIQFKRKKHFGIPFTLLAFYITLMLSYEGICALGKTNIERLINMSPILVGLFIGLILMETQAMKEE